MTGGLAVLQQGVAEFALHALWQVPLLAGAAWCAIRVGRPHVRAAYAVWVCTLLLCVGMPLVATIAARQAAWAAERAAQDASITYETRAYTGDLPALDRAPAWRRLLHRHLNGRDGLQPFAFALSQRAARIISCGYLSATLFFAIQLLAAWRRTRALVAKASTAVPEGIRRALEEQCQQLRLPVPQACLHRTIAGPALAGVLHPVLLLPAACPAEMTAGEIDAVLAHEMAHLRRRDPLVHAVCSLLLVPVAFHPAAMWAARCVRQTREMACDADAAVHVGSSAAYAHALLRVAERAGIRQSRDRGFGYFSNGLFGTGLGLFTYSLELFTFGLGVFKRNSAMEERMQMLMKSNGSNAQRGSALRVAAYVSLGVVAVLAAGMLQVQPALAHERAATTPQITTPQVASPQNTTPAADPAPGGTQDREPRLLGGDHAREQLQGARGRLDEAERQATTADARRRIAAARDLVAAAESALASAGAPGSANVNVHVDLSKLQVQLDALKLPDLAAVHAQIDAQHEAMAKMQAQLRAQIASPEWQAQMKQTIAKVHSQIDTPEFRQHIIDESLRMSRDLADHAAAIAGQQQAKSMDDLRSAEAARLQVDQARQMAMLQQPQAPFTVQKGKPMKVSSEVLAGNILHKETPVYPPSAKEKHLQGEVLLHVLVGDDGKVEQISVMSSPDTAFSQSAIEAVRQWTYKPVLLNGDAIPVESTVTVHYTLVQ